MRRFTAEPGQMTIDGHVIGVDAEQEENSDWLTWAGHQRYSLSDLQAAFDAGVKHHNAPDLTVAFQSFLEPILNVKDAKQQARRRKKRDHSVKV